MRPSASNAAGSCGGGTHTGRTSKGKVSSVAPVSPARPSRVALRVRALHASSPTATLRARRRERHAAARAQAASSRGARPRDESLHGASPLCAAALARRAAPRARELSPVRLAGAPGTVCEPARMRAARTRGNSAARTFRACSATSSSVNRRLGRRMSTARPPSPTCISHRDMAEDLDKMNSQSLSRGDSLLVRVVGPVEKGSGGIAGTGQAAGGARKAPTARDSPAFLAACPSVRPRCASAPTNPARLCFSECLSNRRAGPDIIAQVRCCRRSHDVSCQWCAGQTLRHVQSSKAYGRRGEAGPEGAAARAPDGANPASPRPLAAPHRCPGMRV